MNRLEKCLGAKAPVPNQVKPVRRLISILKIHQNLKRENFKGRN